MGQYLQVIESRYPASQFSAAVGPALDRIREAATAYAHGVEHGKVAAQGITKVILIDHPGERRVEDLVDVLSYEHPLREQAWINALALPHERYIGEMHHALRELGSARRWDLEALDAVYRRTVLGDCRFAGVRVEPRWNRSRSCTLGVEWSTTDEVRCHFIVTPVKGSRSSITFMTSPIGLGKIEGVSARLTWEDDRHATLWHRNKRDRWRIDTGTLDVNFLYGPAEDGNPHGQYALGKMYLEGTLWTLQDRAKAVFWLEKAANNGFARAGVLLAGLR